jgi:hypothetical protein
MSEQNEHQASRMNWKTQTYVLGVLLGAAMGFLSAYLFAKEAEDNAENDERPKVPPSAMLGLALSVIGLVRQISEVGKNKKDKKK